MPSVIDYNVEFKQPACAACGPDYYTATAYRSSDHDPVVVGLNLLKRIGGTSGRDTITGTAGDDVIHGGEGADTVTTGTGRDVLVYTSLRDGLDTVTDFTPGSDRIDLSALLASIGVQAEQALSQGVVRLVATSAGTQVQIDTDGSAGPTAARPLALLRGVTPAQLQTGRDLGL
jgi:Ca2+-binding RTX toxin-like protein